MKTEKDSKSFAFKLATDAKQKTDKQPWQVRDSVAVAGCSGPDARGPSYVPYRSDAGYYC